mgnify:CR=1 FL=1
MTVVTYSAKFSRCFVQARHLKILQNACLVVCTQKCPFAAAYRLLQKDESTLSYFFVVPPFFPESSHLQAQQDTKANALISLCGNGHNTVQTYLLLSFQSDAPRCIHDKRCSAPLTSRQLSVSSFLSLLLLFFAFMNLSYQRMRGLSRNLQKNFSICYQNLKESSLPTRLGILASQNCLLTDIADFLLEPSKKINVVDRLPSHLERGGSNTLWDFLSYTF